MAVLEANVLLESAVGGVVLRVRRDGADVRRVGVDDAVDDGARSLLVLLADVLVRVARVVAAEVGAVDEAARAKVVVVDLDREDKLINYALLPR